MRFGPWACMRVKKLTVETAGRGATTNSRQSGRRQFCLIVTWPAHVRHKAPLSSAPKSRTAAKHHAVKIALVTETFPPEINGVAMTFGVIARELGRRGHAVTVYRPRRRDLPGAAAHPEFAEVALPGMPIPGYPLLRLG